MEERANRGGQSDPCALMFPSSAPALLFKHCGRAPGPAYRAFHMGNGYRPMFLSLADLPVRDALPGCGYEWRPPGWSAMKNRPVCWLSWEIWSGLFLIYASW